MKKGRAGKSGCDRKMLWNGSWNFPLVFGVFVISAAFWFVSAPLVRYGYAYVTVLPLITFGFLFLLFEKSKVGKKREKVVHVVFCLAVIGFLFTRVTGLASDIARTWKEPYYFAQTDYVDGEAETKIVNDVIFYEPVEGGLIGYYKFPSSLFYFPFELRGDSLEDGFRQLPME
jgi:hypothetical protein